MAPWKNSPSLYHVCPGVSTPRCIRRGELHSRRYCLHPNYCGRRRKHDEHDSRQRDVDRGLVPEFNCGQRGRDRISDIRQWLERCHEPSCRVSVSVRVIEGSHPSEGIGAIEFLSSKANVKTLRHSAIGLGMRVTVDNPSAAVDTGIRAAR